jgi:hypothetical protein
LLPKDEGAVLVGDVASVGEEGEDGEEEDTEDEVDNFRSSPALNVEMGFANGREGRRKVGKV